MQDCCRLQAVYSPIIVKNFSTVYISISFISFKRYNRYLAHAKSLQDLNILANVSKDTINIWRMLDILIT